MWTVHNGRPPSGPSCFERSMASFVYLLPALDGFEFGGAIYRELPALNSVAKLVAPVVVSYQSIPLSSLIFFLALSAFATGTLRGSLSGFVRFNIQQALFLDMVLLLPFLFPELGNWVLHAVGPAGMVACRNGMWAIAFGTIGYSAARNAQGLLPDQVPVISDAAKTVLEGS